MEDTVYYIKAVFVISVALCVTNIQSQDTTEKQTLYPLPAETPGTPLTIESEVIGPFRIWHIVGFCAVGVLIIVVIVCCCVDVRIPRTKEEIEKSYQQRILNKKFTEDMANPFGPANRPQKPGKRLQNRIPVTNPSFTPDDADIIYASEPHTKSRVPALTDQAQRKSYRVDSQPLPLHNQVSRNPSNISERYEYQIQPTERASRAPSNLSRQRDTYLGKPQQPRSRDNRLSSDSVLNGSAAMENSQNFQRERLAYQSSKSQQGQVSVPKPRLARNHQQHFKENDFDNEPRTNAKISRAARFGVQTPLANHPSLILGPKRTHHEGHLSLASTARTLAAMSPHPGHSFR